MSAAELMPLLRSTFRRAAGSFSSVRARPATGSHLFRIDGCSLVHRMVGRGDSVTSGEFPAAGHRWRLAYYPNGTIPGDDHRGKPRSVGVGLQLASWDFYSSGIVNAAAATACRVSILDRAGMPAFSCLMEPGRVLKCDLVKKEELMKWAEDHVDDDRLHVRCDITVLRMKTETRVQSYLRDFWSGRD